MLPNTRYLGIPENDSGEKNRLAFANPYPSAVTLSRRGGRKSGSICASPAMMTFTSAANALIYFVPDEGHARVARSRHDSARIVGAAVVHDHYVINEVRHRIDDLVDHQFFFVRRDYRGDSSALIHRGDSTG
jgi:hypothetical protein